MHIHLKIAVILLQFCCREELKAQKNCLLVVKKTKKLVFLFAVLNKPVDGQNWRVSEVKVVQDILSKTTFSPTFSLPFFLLLVTRLCSSLLLDSQGFLPEHRATCNLHLQRQYAVCIIVRQWLILLQLLCFPLSANTNASAVHLKGGRVLPVPAGCRWSDQQGKSLWLSEGT